MLVTGTFFTISSGDIDTALGYTGNLLSDFLPILLVFLGIMIFSLIIGAFKR